MTGRKLAPICRTLGISRACAYRESVGWPARYVRGDDRAVTAVWVGGVAVRRDATGG